MSERRPLKKRKIQVPAATSTPLASSAQPEKTTTQTEYWPDNVIDDVKDDYRLVFPDGP